MRYLYLPEDHFLLVFQQLLKLLCLFSFDLLPFRLHRYDNVDPGGIRGAPAYPLHMRHVNRGHLLLWHAVPPVSVILRVCYHLRVLIGEKERVLGGKGEGLERVGGGEVFDDRLGLPLVDGGKGQGEEAEGVCLEPEGEELRHKEGRGFRLH